MNFNYLHHSLPLSTRGPKTDIHKNSPAVSKEEEEEGFKMPNLLKSTKLSLIGTGAILSSTYIGFIIQKQFMHKHLVSYL